jgi:hypothetical protein
MLYSPLIRRLLVFTSLAAFVSACVGVPLVSPHQGPQKDRSLPFPCQDSVCGCMSAEQCWKSCCCQNDREKVAWAKKHRVTPPEFVFAAAKLELSVEPASKKTCCSTHIQAAKKPKKNCCSEEITCDKTDSSTDRIVRPTKAADSKSCCSSHGTASASKQTSKNVRWRWANGISALKCRGLAYDWTTLGMIDVPPDLEVHSTISRIEWVFLATPSFTTVDDSPTVPPPKRHDV